ncbi:MAG: bifunctional DNA-formamidopyrimidine glycosylase/DNA-(apurinic or apyrimidinic site) lyase [Desulfovibrio sp.]|nr:bifunctional DNA-formamidopyrimidine glycosylase/DNA-(apurinic or apyrimidinic site) lyase [Desulfovibrio sp.]
MPELPEAETVARTLYPHIHNCRFRDVRLLRKASLHPLSLPPESLRDQVINDVSRRGKLILLNLVKSGNDAPEYLIFHLRMTGRVFTAEANRALGKHTRCVFDLEKPGGLPFQLFFDDIRTFGQIFIAASETLNKWKFWRELGPEPLELEIEDFAPRFKGARSIKQALLDQRFVAGIGNIYADEALFRAGIAPNRPVNAISGDEKKALLSTIKETLNESISQCGSSIRDYRDADGNVGAFQNNFAVYGRGGQKCRRCGTVLVKTRQGGRTTVFCPSCQK